MGSMLLVQPPQGTSFGFARILTGEPLGLECVGGALRAEGYEATIVDLRLDGWEALDEALGAGPAAIGISCSFTTDVYATLEIAAFVKERLPEVPVVVGGHHASLLPRDFLRPGSKVDAVAIGEGERTAVELMGALRQHTPVDAVAGLLTPSNQSGGFRPRRFSSSLDDLAGPDRSLTARYRNRYHHGLMTHSVSVETSRGCPFDCNFCSVSRFFGRRFLRRSAASVVRELEGLKAAYAFICDDLAFLDRKVYRELAERIRSSGIRMTFSCETRSDLILRNRDLLPLWRKAGMDTIFLGLEKIDDAGLAAVRKRTAGGASTNVEAIRTLAGEGIITMATFITDPDWEERDFDCLEEFLDRVKLPSPGFTILTPLPGTELHEQCKRRLVTHDYRYYDVAHTVLPTRLPIERFYQRFAQLYDHAIAEVRPSLAMLRRAAALAVKGDFWCMRKVYGAIQQMRNPAEYLRPLPRVKAPGHLARAVGPKISS